MIDYNFKVHVPTPEISEMVQKKLFEMGFTWYGGGKDVNLKREKYLFVCFSGDSFYSHSFTRAYKCDDQFFEKHKSKQLHYLQVLTWNDAGRLFMCKGDDWVYYQIDDYYYCGDCKSPVPYDLDWILQNGNGCLYVVDVNEQPIKQEKENMNSNMSESKDSVACGNHMPNLEVGKHVVKAKHGYGIVLPCNNLSEVGWVYLDNGGWDYGQELIEAVYEVTHPFEALLESTYENATPIWKRDSEKDILRKEYEELMQQVNDLQEKAQSIREKL